MDLFGPCHERLDSLGPCEPDADAALDQVAATLRSVVLTADGTDPEFEADIGWRDAVHEATARLAQAGWRTAPSLLRATQASPQTTQGAGSWS